MILHSELLSTEMKQYPQYSRLVDKDKIPVCNILGVNIAAINMNWLLKYLFKHIKNPEGNLLSGDYICVSNVHTTITAYEDADYCRIQNNGLMAIPDGGPLAKFGRRQGHLKMARTAGPSLMEEVFKRSVECGYCHYFLGSTEDTLNRMMETISEKYPGIKIVGKFSPPFRPLTAEEDWKITHEINLADPDFIWVGLGAPKQENWMAEHQGSVCGLMMGVGAGFDYFAGNIKRAPEWMQNRNLEWLYRLLQDPRRLFKRYMKTNIEFLWLVAKGYYYRLFRKEKGYVRG